MNVRIITGTNGSFEQEMIIDDLNRQHWKWFKKHLQWAVRNDRVIVIQATEDKVTFKNGDRTD